MTQSYEKKKRFFNEFITLFGRKPVSEALQSDEIEPVRLHLADSNKPSAELDEMTRIAQARRAEILTHSRAALSRISRNGKQDQGVAIDIRVKGYRPLQDLLDDPTPNKQLIAVNDVTNPQNLGMIIRSVGASPMYGLLLATRGNARIDGLVVKAAAGTLFKTRIYHCEDLAEALVNLAPNFSIVGLDGHGSVDIREVPTTGNTVFIVGNETSGLSSKVRQCCNVLAHIPLANNIESLNVSVAASIVSFRSLFAAKPQ